MTPSLQEIEQFIPFVKPLFDGLRSARDFFASGKRTEAGHGIDIPKRTLILLPEVNSHELLWRLVKWGDKDGMQICGRLQATNTSPFGIRAAGIRLLSPRGVEPIIQTVSVKDPDTGLDDSKHLMPTHSIGDLRFMFCVVPVTGTPGKRLTAAISVLDQFGNEHVVRGLQFSFIGPEQLPA